MERRSQWMLAHNRMMRQSFAWNLRCVRERQELSLVQAANLIGVSRSHLSRLESGKAQPKLDLALLMAQKLNTSFDELFAVVEKYMAIPTRVSTPIAYHEAFNQREYSALTQRNEGQTFKSIAETLGVSITAARKCYKRAILTQQQVYLQKIGESTGITDKELYELSESLYEQFDADIKRINAYLERKYEALLAAYRSGET